MVTAMDGVEAVQKVKDANMQGDEFALILMDCNMPRMDGYQATMEIREFLSQRGDDQPQIVALTGHIEDSYIKRAFKSGMNSYIKKPA